MLMTSLAAQLRTHPRTRILSVALATVTIMSAFAAGAASPASGSSADHADGDLISSTTYVAPAVAADTKLLIHYMPSIKGKMIRASSLLFVPKGAPPPGGWPVVAWAHGTTTPGQRKCAPSLTPVELDGGLTADGFKSNYAGEISSFVRAGYAVIAPDFEGLGSVSDVPYPYFNAASLARSLISAVRAARHAVPSLSSNYAVVGHSDGGHAVLEVEAFTAEAPELNLKATVALAPYTSISATVSASREMAERDPQTASDDLAFQNFNVALMGVGLRATLPEFDVSSVMGDDLERLLPDFIAQCSVEAIDGVTAAVKARPQTFAGYKRGWDSIPEMKAFLLKNDPDITPGFHLRLPVLIEQGTNDKFVLESLDSAFVAKLRATGTLVIYKVYPGDDHFQIIPDGNADALRFLATYLR